MEFDELFALYGVQTEGDKILSDKEIFAKESGQTYIGVESQGPTTIFYEEKESSSEIIKDNNVIFQSGIHVQKQETILNNLDYPLLEESANFQEEYIKDYEYPLQDSLEEKDYIEDLQNISEDKEDKESYSFQESTEQEQNLSENDLFWKAVSGQKVTFPKEPEEADLISSKSELSPLEALMGSENSKDTDNDQFSNNSNGESVYYATHHRKAHIPSLGNPFKGVKVLSEIKVFIVLFLTVFSTFFFFTNAKLVLITVNDFINGEGDTSVSLITETNEHNVADIVSQKQEKLDELEENFQNIQKYKREEQDLALNMQEFLNQQQEAHLLNFNTLPPTNRLIVPDLGINVPLIDIPSMGEEDFENGNFDEELMHGVVKYPTTAIPGSQGNSLIFGHSSSEWWKHNEYGFIFRNLPTLQPGQKIQVIWNGQLTTYEMIERKVVNPKEVGEYYHQFVREGEYYLTLMGCYPIGSSSQRMMVVAKKVAND